MLIQSMKKVATTIWHTDTPVIRYSAQTIFLVLALICLLLASCSNVKKREGDHCDPKGLPSTLVRTVLSKDSVACVYENEETDVKKCVLTPKPLIAREWIVSGSRDNPIRICIKKCKGLVLEHVSCEYTNC